MVSKFCSLMVLSLLSTITVIAQPTWKRVYGGYDVDLASDAVATVDGGIVVVGTTGSFGQGSSDVYLFKVNGDGIRQWSTTLGSPAIETANALVLMSDGGFLIAGTTNATSTGDYNGLVMRTDENGNLLWQRDHGGDGWDFLYSAAATPDGGAVLAGLSYSEGLAGVAWILRVDAEGDTLWTTHLAGAGYTDARSVKVTPDGGFVIAGRRTDETGEGDALVAKFDGSAVLEWSYTYGGDSLDFARDIILTSDGGYSILGVTKSLAAVSEQYHFKIDAFGNLEWQRNWGQIADQQGFQHLQLDNGEYASIGFVTQGGAGGKDMFLLKSGTDGDFIFGQTQGGVQDDVGHAILRLDGGYLMCGITESYGSGLWDIFLVRTNEVGFTASNIVINSFDPLSIEEPTPAAAPLVLFPNPSTGWIEIGFGAPLVEVRLLDALGRVVEQHRLNAGVSRISSRLPSGAYILEATAQNGELRRGRILIERP